MDIAVVIPTYNETENIGCLLEQIFTHQFVKYAIIVDDNSPDGTGAYLEQLKKTNYRNNLIIIHRQSKQGLGSAYAAGFKEALKYLQIKAVITMDADLSHSPTNFPKIYDIIQHDADIVIGSRYIAGGGVNWQLYRRVLSKGANFLASLFLNLKVNDVTSGYRCYHRKVLEKIQFENIHSWKNYYSIQKEIISELQKHQFFSLKEKQESQNCQNTKCFFFSARF